MFRASEGAFLQVDRRSTLETQMWGQSWAKAQRQARALALEGPQKLCSPGVLSGGVSFQSLLSPRFPPHLLGGTPQLQGEGLLVECQGAHPLPGRPVPQRGTDADCGKNLPYSV